VPVEQVAEVREAPELAEVPEVRGTGGVPLGVPVADEVPARDRVAGAAGSGPPTVTLTAVGTEIRSLLVVLAEAAGVDLVVDPAVEGRVTVHFQDVPAREALERVIRETGHMVARPLAVPFPPTVYYVVPVNVNEADAATIRARFDVSAELARFILRSRIPPHR
jgi:type II secretory pathway component GspD/PulD (secretin)